MTGTLKAGTGATPGEGRLAGDRITFTAGAARHTGRLNGATVQGTAVTGTGGASTAWQATRGPQGREEI